MNRVERFFADITEECVRAGGFPSVPLGDGWGPDSGEDPACEGGLGRCPSKRSVLEALDTS